MTRKNQNCIILSPALSQSLACARILKRNLNQPHLIGAWLPDESELYISDLYDGFIKIDENYELDELSKYDKVIPTGSKGTKWLLSRRDEIEIGDQVMDSDALNVYNKIRILNIAAEQDVPIPQTYYSYKEAKNHDGPLFYKPRIEGSGGERDSVRYPRNLPHTVRTEDYIFQEKINSRGTYGVGFLAEEGDITLSTSHYELYSFPSAGGSAAVIKPYRHKRLLDYTKRILSTLNYTGWGLAEFKWCPTREDFIFMEVNGKLWASIELAFRIEPEWSEKLFNIDVSPQNLKGLIWLDRLIGSGIRQTVSSIPYFVDFDFVWDSPFFRRLLGKASPVSVKRFVSDNILSF